MKRYLSLAALFIFTVAVSATIGGGCAYRRADRNLVQPLAFNKRQFLGEWYYMKTVYEAPYESGFFNGQGGWPLGKKIRFEITERYLYAFNTSPNVRNTQSEVTPVAAWPIVKHFDVKPRINYSTGEPSNVIVEERSDGLPWYQRKYMRVKWERSMISDWSDIIGTYYRWIGRVRIQPALYVPPEKFEVQPDYMSFVADILVTKLYTAIYNYFLYEIPFSSFRIRERYSFKKVKPSTYTPKEYDDYMFSKFGVFRTTVVRYHPDRGLVDWSYKFFANRHNVATGEEIKKGTKKPKKIVYYLSPNFPKDLMEAAQEVADSWNAAFAYALQRPAKDKDGKNAIFELRKNDDGLPKGQRRELGDLRYNYIWGVDVPQTGSPLGYGPSLADPDTGEIVHGAAYVYIAPLRRLVDHYMVLFDLLSGRYSFDDVTSGLDYFNAVFSLNGHKIFLARKEGSKQQYFENGVLAPQIRLNTMGKLLQRVKSPDFMVRMKKLRQLDRSTIMRQIAKFSNDPKVRASLMNDYVVQLAFPGADTAQILANAEIDPEIKKALSLYHPIELMKPHKIRELLDAFVAPSKVNMYMYEYMDPILEKYVLWHIKNKTPRDEVRKSLLKFMFVAVTAHEVGHTLGFTHNFIGSTDEFNYYDAYHILKSGKTPKYCGLAKKKCDPAKMDPGFYRTASIMDYAGEMYDDQLGVGKTDRAALAFVYGGLVETAVKNPLDQGKLIKWSLEVEKKAQDPKDPLKLRKFKFCSDYFVGQDPLCERWDSGPTALDIVEYHILNYDRNYPLRYWRRGRRAFSPSSILGRLFYRFRQIANIYQDWAYRVTTQPDYISTEDFKDKLKAIQRSFKFFMRILFTPSVGVHKKDREDGIWRQFPRDEDKFAPKLNIKLGEGRYFYSRYMDGYFGIYRYSRVGTLYDKWITLLVLGLRDWGYYNNYVNWLYVSYYDLFTEDMKDLLSQTLSDVWDKNNKLLFRKCEEDANGKCKRDSNGKIKYYPVEPAWHFFLQYIGMALTLTSVNNPFSDNTLANYMLVGIKGSGKSWAPPGMGEVQCPDINKFTGQFSCPKDSKVICFNNFYNTRTYFAVQTKDKRSISYRLVSKGCNLANQLALLRKTGADRLYIERKLQELRYVETVLTIMQYYVSLVEGN